LEDLTQRIRLAYDRAAPVYPLSSRVFHRRAHSRLLELAGEIDGCRVLEVATGSGELFRQLLAANASGVTVGVDLSPAMAAAIRPSLNGDRSRYSLQAGDARQLPFRDGYFDLLVACYLFELLSDADLSKAAGELRRVIRPGGRLLLTSASQSQVGFNFVYRALSRTIPTFWGRQVAKGMPGVLTAAGFRVTHQETVQQSGYPTDIVMAESKLPATV
jgi:ubiquinone/menaquinone biosynthesis C-methylase UbiE